VKEGFLKEYLESDQEDPKGEVALRDQVHEIPINGELTPSQEDSLKEGALLPNVSDTRE